MKVIKKDETVESFDIAKIINAAEKAASRLDTKLSQKDKDALEDTISAYLSDNTYKYVDDIKTKELHTIVIQCLKYIGRNDVAKSYQEYRDYKNTYAKAWEEMKETTDAILFLGDRENANFDSSLISTKGALMKGALAKELYKQFYLSKTEKEMIKRGDIYIHDLRDLIFHSINCCLFDMGNVLKDGFEMSNTKYTEPKSVLTALQVIGDVTMVASANQYGGFTTAEIDKILLPYVKKSLSHWFSFFNTECELDKDKSMKLAKDKVKEELKQGFQSYELKLNTLPSSRGDYPFTTITFMQWDPNLPEEDRYWLAEIDKAILKTRYIGHGNKPALFPKLVALFDKNQYDLDKYTKEVFDECIYCSSKCLYPDMLSLIGNPKHNTVAKVYLDSNKKVITSPMGEI